MPKAQNLKLVIAVITSAVALWAWTHRYTYMLINSEFGTVIRIDHWIGQVCYRSNDTGQFEYCPKAGR